MSLSTPKVRGPQIAKRTVLIIDDDAAVGAALKRWFDLKGHPVRTVANTKSALDEVEKDQPDVVITDLVRERGEDCVQIARALALAGCRVIIHTAYPDAQRLGIEFSFPVFEKPANLDALTTEVEKQ